MLFSYVLLQIEQAQLEDGGNGIGREGGGRDDDICGPQANVVHRVGSIGGVARRIACETNTMANPAIRANRRHGRIVQRALAEAGDRGGTGEATFCAFEDHGQHGSASMREFVECLDKNHLPHSYKKTQHMSIYNPTKIHPTRANLNQERCTPMQWR